MRTQYDISLDDFIGSHEKRGRYRQAERAGGFQIYRKFDFVWLLDRQISRLRTFENPVDEVRGAPIQLVQTRTVGDDKTSRRPFPRSAYRGKMALLGQLSDHRSLSKQQGASKDDDGAHARSHHRGE